ncbi:MAG: hypothetical protein ABI123_01655 [Ginsengibacter sp.]
MISLIQALDIDPIINASLQMNAAAYTTFLTFQSDYSSEVSCKVPQG